MIRKHTTLSPDRILISARRKQRGYVVRTRVEKESRVSTKYFASVDYYMVDAFYAESLDFKVRSEPFLSVERAVEALLTFKEFTCAK